MFRFLHLILTLNIFLKQNLYYNLAGEFITLYSPVKVGFAAAGLRILVYIFDF